MATISTGAREIVAISPEGDVGRGYGNFQLDDLSSRVPPGPDVLGPMREIRVVGEGLLAVGMGRQVYRWTRKEGWRALHSAAMVEREDLMAVSGFNSIHGDSMSDLWAVGMGGEIWEYRQRGWKRATSPTNLALNRVHVTGKAEAIAVGQSGVVLECKDRNWRHWFTLEQGEDIWSIARFNGATYLSTETAIFRIDPAGNTADPVAVPGVETFGHLDAADGVLWSCGFSDIAYTLDGAHWSVVTP